MINTFKNCFFASRKSGCFFLVSAVLAGNGMTARAAGSSGSSGGVDFSGLTGPNLSQFNGITQGDFTVTPTVGEWLQATYYGAPAPSILTGPINNPGVSSLLITDTAGPFIFSSLSFSSNNGDSAYDILGYMGATEVYEATGDLPGSYGPFTFSSLLPSGASGTVDALVIEVIPGAGVTSVNLDDIGLTTVLASPGPSVPESGPTFLMLCAGLSAMACLRGKLPAV